MVLFVIQNYSKLNDKGRDRLEMAGETEFEDILIKHGIIQDPEANKPKEEQHVYSTKDTVSHSEEDEDFSNDEDFFEQFKQKRMAELSAANEVMEISRPDFVKEVSEASKTKPVIVHLYNDTVEASAILKRDIRMNAKNYPQIKFVEIVASRCIPDYPDALVPTILYYYQGILQQKVTNAKPDGLCKFLNTIVETIQ